MQEPLRDVAQTRFDNAVALFEEFSRLTAPHADSLAMRGLEGRFAARLQIQPSYWSQIKARSRQIGERLARQFERLMHKPVGWMDEPHASAEQRANAPAHAPLDDDERFIVALVLSYYRRDPMRARARLLQLLGEALQAAPAAPVLEPMRVDARGVAQDDQLWSRTRAAVAPLKRKR